MYIYIVELFFIWFFNILCFHSTVGKNRKKLFLFLTITMMTLVLGLRAGTVGEDTNHYIDVFNYAGSVSWNNIFSSRFRTVYYVNQFGYADTIENGFLNFIKIIRWFTTNPQIFLFIMASLTLGCIAKFIYDNSEDVFCSTYVLLCESLYMFSFNAARQMLALAIGINAYTLLENKKNKSAIFVLLLALYIHNSSLVLFLMPLVMMFKSKNEDKSYKRFKYVFFVIVSIPVLLPLVETLVAHVLPRYTAYFQNNYWEVNIGGTTVFWILELYFIFYMYNRKFAFKNSFEYSALSSLYLLFEIIGLRITGIGRIAMYFRAFLILFFPTALQAMKKNRYGRIFKYVLYLLLTFAFLSYASTDARRYSFFWQ